MNAIEPVEIVLDKPRKMLFTFGALKAAEREINKIRTATGEAKTSVFTILGEMSPDTISILVWACLLHEDSTLTIEQVDAMPFNMEIAAKINQCLGVQIKSEEAPDEEGNEGGGSRPLARQNGSTSGRSPGLTSG